MPSQAGDALLDAGIETMRPGKYLAENILPAENLSIPDAAHQMGIPVEQLKRLIQGDGRVEKKWLKNSPNSRVSQKVFGSTCSSAETISNELARLIRPSQPLGLFIFFANERVFW